MLYSFDIFDTLLTRKTGTPVGIFSIIQNKLQKDSKYKDYPYDLKENYYSIRIDAERKSRSSIRIDKEITINLIYSFIRERYQLSDQQIEDLISLECDTEIENLIGIAENIEMLKDIISRGERVILVSDMYLSCDIVKKFLLKIDPIFATLPIYISSDVHYTKSHGKLFKYIKKHERIRYHDWIHIGDNMRSDYYIPKLFGINAKLYKKSRLLIYEKNLLQKYGTCINTQLLIGTIRCFRLQHPEDTTQSLLSSICIALMFPYVLWILNQAIENNYNNLYFLSRDGYVLKIIADSIIKKRDLNISTKYIYSSRIAWRIPSSYSDAAYTYDPYHLGFSSITEIATLLNLNNKEIKDVVPQHLLNKNKITHTEFSTIIENIHSNKKLSKQLTEYWEKKREGVIQYFSQEVDLNSKFALVDLYGSGATIERLQTILNPYISKPINVFYMGMGGITEEINNHIKKINYKKWDNSSINSPNILVEALCFAPSRKCIGYIQEKSTIKPLFDEGSAYIYQSYNKYFEWIDQLTDIIINYLPNIEDDKTFTEISNYCWNYLNSAKVNKQIINAIGDIPFEYNKLLRTIEKFAPKYSIKDICTETISILKSKHFSKTYFPYYSFLRGKGVIPIFGYIYLIIWKNIISKIN